MGSMFIDLIQPKMPIVRANQSNMWIQPPAPHDKKQDNRFNTFRVPVMSKMHPNPARLNPTHGYHWRRTCDLPVTSPTPCHQRPLKTHSQNNNKDNDDDDNNNDYQYYYFQAHQHKAAGMEIKLLLLLLLLLLFFILLIIIILNIFCPMV